MRELFIFAVGSSITLSVFLISLLELIFTVRRRKHETAMREQVKLMRATYNESLSKLVLEDEAKMEEVEKQAEASNAQSDEEKKKLEEDFQAKIDDLTAKSEKALESAKAKAKKLEQEAKVKADEYAKARQKEVEEDLMNLVISVTKKVLPAGITYDGQKELVMQALRDLKVGGKEEE